MAWALHGQHFFAICCQLVMLTVEIIIFSCSSIWFSSYYQRSIKFEQCHRILDECACFYMKFVLSSMCGFITSIIFANVTIFKFEEQKFTDTRFLQEPPQKRVRERGNYHIPVYLSYNQHKNPTIVLGSTCTTRMLSFSQLRWH